MSGEGGSWCAQDVKMTNDFYHLVSFRPLVAFKILTLLTIVEMGGLPLIKISLVDDEVVEGDFDGVLFERGNFKLAINIPDKEIVKVDPLLVKEISVIIQDSEHITEESIARNQATHRRPTASHQATPK